MADPEVALTAQESTHALATGKPARAAGVVMIHGQILIDRKRSTNPAPTILILQHLLIHLVGEVEPLLPRDDPDAGSTVRSQAVTLALV